MTAPEPPADIPPHDFAVIRSVNALRRWGGAKWRWTGDGWTPVRPARADGDPEETRRA